MSRDLVHWAQAQPIKKATTKYVLITMASRAYPFFFASNAKIRAWTGLNEKTVRQALVELRGAGYVEIVEKPAGKSTVFKIIHNLSTTPTEIGSGHPPLDPLTPTNNGTPTPAEIGTGTPTKNGTQKKNIYINNAHVDTQPVDNLRKVLQ